MSGAGVGEVSVGTRWRSGYNGSRAIPFLGSLEGGSFRCYCPTARTAQCR